MYRVTGGEVVLDRLDDQLHEVTACTDQHGDEQIALQHNHIGLTLTVLVTTIDAQWEGMGDVGSARHEPALLPPCPTIRVLSYSN